PLGERDDPCGVQHTGRDEPPSDAAVHLAPPLSGKGRPHRQDDAQHVDESPDRKSPTARQDQGGIGVRHRTHELTPRTTAADRPGHRLQDDRGQQRHRTHQVASSTLHRTGTVTTHREPASPHEARRAMIHFPRRRGKSPTGVRKSASTERTVAHDGEPSEASTPYGRRGRYSGIAPRCRHRPVPERPCGTPRSVLSRRPRSTVHGRATPSPGSETEPVFDPLSCGSVDEPLMMGQPPSLSHRILMRGRLRMRTVKGRTDHVVVVGAGLSGLSAALHLAGRGRRVTVLEREPVPGGRAGRLDRDGYLFDTGPTVLTMPDVVESTLAAVGDSVAERVPLVRVEPAYRAEFADGSGLDVHSDGEAMAAEVERFAGPAEAAGYLRLRAWLHNLYRVQFDRFIAANLDSPLAMVTPELARLAALGGFRRLEAAGGRVPTPYRPPSGSPLRA